MWIVNSLRINLTNSKLLGFLPDMPTPCSGLHILVWTPITLQVVMGLWSACSCWEAPGVFSPDLDVQKQWHSLSARLAWSAPSLVYRTSEKNSFLTNISCYFSTLNKILATFPKETRHMQLYDPTAHSTSSSFPLFWSTIANFSYIWE